MIEIIKYKHFFFVRLCKRQLLPETSVNRRFSLAVLLTNLKMFLRNRLRHGREKNCPRFNVYILMDKLKRRPRTHGHGHGRGMMIKHQLPIITKYIKLNINVQIIKSVVLQSAIIQVQISAEFLLIFN